VSHATTIVRADRKMAHGRSTADAGHTSRAVSTYAVDVAESDPRNDPAPAPRVRERTESVSVWGLFLTLPIERLMTLDAMGFTLRPVYPFMALLVVLNARSIPRSGVAGVVAVGIALAVAGSAVDSLGPKQTAGYAAWGIFTLVFFVSTVGRLREQRYLVASWTNTYVFTAGLWGLFTLAHAILSFAFEGMAFSFVGDLPRVQALAYEPSFLAYYLVPAFYLSFATRQHYSTAGILAGVIASTSRSGLVGLAAGGVVLLLLERRAVIEKLLICGVAAALGVGLQLHLSAGQYSGFVSKTVTTVARGETDQASITPRLQTWDDAWDVFLDHPLNGVGAGAYGGGVNELGIALDVPEEELETTNLWLETLAELGVPGLAALLAMLVTAVVGLWKNRRREPLATFVITAIVASVAMFPFVQTLWVPYRWIVWMLAFSLAFPLVAEPKRSRDGTWSAAAHGITG
jgi:O-antigen ligase